MFQTLTIYVSSFSEMIEVLLMMIMMMMKI